MDLKTNGNKAGATPEQLETRLPFSYEHATEFFRVGRIDEAERLLSLLFCRNPLDSDVINDLGAIAFHRGETLRAKALFRRALELAPNSAEIHDNLNSLASSRIADAAIGPIESSRFSLAILSSRSSPDLDRLLSSLAAQTLLPTEILLGSDSQEQGLTALLARHPELKVTTVCTTGCTNSAEQKQLLLNTINTEFVVICNSDHVLAPNCLERLYSSINSDSESAVVSAVWPTVGENTPIVDVSQIAEHPRYKPSIEKVVSSSSIFWRTGEDLCRHFHIRHGVVLVQLTEGRCSIYRKSAVTRVGGFATGLSRQAYRAEADLSVRLYYSRFKQFVDFGANAPYFPQKESANLETALEVARDGYRFLIRLKRYSEESRQRRVLSFGRDELSIAFVGSEQFVSRYTPMLPDYVVQIPNDSVADRHSAQLLLVEGSKSLATLTPNERSRAVVIMSPGEEIAELLAQVERGEIFALATSNEKQLNGRMNSQSTFIIPPAIDGDLFYPAPYSANERRAILLDGLTYDEYELTSRLAREGFQVERLNRGDSAELRRNAYHRAQLAITTNPKLALNQLLEAMACGVPVFSSSAVPELSGECNVLGDFKVLPLSGELTNLGRKARISLEGRWTIKKQRTWFQQMIRELQRRVVYGPFAEAPIDERAVQLESREYLTERGIQTPFRTRELADYILRREGRYTYLDDSFLTAGLADEIIANTANLLSVLPPFYLHLGGIGDGLLLLSSFYDRAPRSKVLAITPSLGATKALYDAFPEIEEIYLFPMPKHPDLLRVVRQYSFQVSNCLGRGTTPFGDHEKEWTAGVDIFSRYGISLAPSWARNFGSGSPAEIRAVIAPCGSLVEMMWGKKNIIAPGEWPEILDSLARMGVQTTIIGTPAERAKFPAISGAIDRRSFNLREQMEIIAGSSFLIGADSWAKTFAALAGVPTFVFPPLVHNHHTAEGDPSSNIFLFPWKSISLVHSPAELFAAIQPILNARRIEPNRFTIRRYC